MKGARLIVLAALLAAIFTFVPRLSAGEVSDFSFGATSKLEVTNDVACGFPVPITCEEYNDLDSYEVNAPLTIVSVGNGGDFLTDVKNNVIEITFYTSNNCSGEPISDIRIPAANLVQHGKKGAYVFDGAVGDFATEEGAFVSVNLTLNSATSPTSGTLLLEGNARLCGGVTDSTPELAQSMQVNIGFADSDITGDIDTACQPVTEYETLDLSSTDCS